MKNTIKRTAAATIAGGIAAGGLVLVAGTADAMPSDRPCGIADVNVSVTPDSAHAAGQEGYEVSYVAASPTTNCKLRGIPTAVTFMAGQNNASDTTVTPDAPGAAPVPVNLTANHPAVSYILQDADAPVTFVPTALNMNLPTPGGNSTTVSWPTGAPLKGHTAQLTAVAPQNAG